jgi:LysR family glycine cleavage system transcriptional activator
LQSLRAFEAVARLLSFRRAGEELLVTQSAISHHIAVLERELGAKLFVRKARGVRLTPEGERYFAAVEHAFDIIGTSTNDLRGTARQSRVRVSVLPSFAANWLVVRLARFTQAHPDIDLVLEPTLRLANLDDGEADLAIRYGDGKWDDVACQLLMTERLAPVASPALLNQRGGAPLKPKDILDHTLLLPLRAYDWDIWASANGVDLRGARTIQLSDYNIVLQAAADGQGIAIGRLLLIADRLRSGALVQACAEAVSSAPVGHWLVTPRKAKLTAAAKTVADWLVQETADFGQQITAAG